ncbi:MAG: hypothetical protein R2702_11300 [Acidimicrobiales bacterium]
MSAARRAWAKASGRLGQSRQAAQFAYHRRIARPRGVRPRGEEPLLDLDGWIERVGPASRIVVVAAGPTANDLEPRAGDLHVTTNSAEAKVADHPYVYFLAEGLHVVRYLNRGPASDRCRGVLLRTAAEGLPALQGEVARRAVEHVRTHRRDVPEVVASDREPEGIERATWDQLNAVVQERLGTPLRQYNSGIGATYVGYVLASTLGVPLHLYGLDAAWAARSTSTARRWPRRRWSATGCGERSPSCWPTSTGSSSSRW